MPPKALKFTGLQPSQHTWYEDATQKIDPSPELPKGYPGPVIRVNPGDVVPLEKFHKGPPHTTLDFAADFIARGIAVEVDMPKEAKSEEAKKS